MRFPLTIAMLIALLLSHTSLGADSPEANPDSRGRKTAVALNYCRAAFHRIRANPIKPVMLEEREKILNNLNLNGIADEEVVKLYTSVLDEISQVTLAEKEKKLFKDRHRRNFLQRTAASAWVISGMVAQADFVSAVRLGANSWWDYRQTTMLRDLDLWKVDKTQATAVNKKSSQFLESFWKLAQKKNIPDAWLIRSTDLDNLDKAMREQNPEVRLRVLKRMEKFMECYPPYWYYLGRTQQTLGQYFAAGQTYDTLAELGAGHFRKDDMLTASLANRAAIQEYLGQPSARRTALEALRYSTSVWEANLMSARVLARHEMYEEAEDAVLRNIDVGLETEYSTAALVAIYYHAEDDENLRKVLADPTHVQRLPVPVILVGLARLGMEDTPEAARKQIQQSLYARASLRFGLDDVVLVTQPAWKVDSAKVSMRLAGRDFTKYNLDHGRNRVEVRFSGVHELGVPFRSQAKSIEPVMTLRYPETPIIRLTLRPMDARQPDRYGIAVVQVGDVSVNLVPASNRQARNPARTRVEFPEQPATENTSTDADVPVPLPRRDPSPPAAATTPAFVPEPVEERLDRETAPLAPPADFEIPTDDGRDSQS